MTLAPYASHPHQSRGRAYDEPECTTRSPHQRDRDRIIHSAAFRRLEYKTQVFVNHEGDHYRTRLTHSIEVSQIARSLARALGCNEDLAEALALAHDLGHTPFGHAGEDALDAAMQNYGGFDHNAQTLRILTKLETRYASFDGLNLTWETLEGIAKHNGPLVGDGLPPLPRAMQDYGLLEELELETHAGLEAQLASIADDIAYNNHDLEDGLRARLFTFEDLAQLPLVGDALRDVDKQFPRLDEKRRTHEVIRRIINQMAADVIAHTRKHIEKDNITTSEDVRQRGITIAHFSPDMREAVAAVKAFLMKRMYRHYKVNRMTSKAERVVRELFGFFMDHPNCLPPQWYEQVEQADEQGRAVLIADYIAGMTDRFALDEYARVFEVGSS